LLDRNTYQAHILILVSESFRFREHFQDDKKKVYHSVNHCQGKEVEQSAPVFRSSSALATVLARRTGCYSALPYRPLEHHYSAIPAWICNWTVFH
jgi:hypothetical protein